MGKSGFRELEVWQEAKELAVYVYRITSSRLFKEDSGLQDQIRRAAVSVPSNIAEGDERFTDKESIRFLYIAKGSLAELITQIVIAHEIGYINSETSNSILDKCSVIGKRLGALIKVRSL
ncbi:MAG: four helix bundle protein [Clostridia bacterium]|nr:four helix bundle protein [Clostridia bacterium]